MGFSALADLSFGSCAFADQSPLKCKYIIITISIMIIIQMIIY